MRDKPAKEITDKEYYVDDYSLNFFPFVPTVNNSSYVKAVFRISSQFCNAVNRIWYVIKYNVVVESGKVYFDYILYYPAILAKGAQLHSQSEEFAQG